MRRALSLLALLLAPLPVLAQRDAKVPDPDPELERKTFVLPPGFEVNLFAADPMLAKPIHMNFDPQGRLWVAASEVYPQIKPGQPATDRVLILEDTNNDGKADKTTVFADGLLIPTGVAPGDGGAYVADSTDLVHFSDPDPATGKARKKRIVLSGFGTEDTHHILHTFRWGPDGCLYMNQSIYIHSHVETPHGVRRLNAGGVWRFRPETVELDVFARGWVNSWGFTFDKWGQTFATDGAGGEGINIAMPGAYYATAANAARILPGLNPGSPKHCGLTVVSGRHFPDDYQGSLVTNDFRGHRVCRFVLKDDGSGYQSVEQQEIIKSTHPAFRPIDVAMGPDGALYVADWYNPIIQHGEVDFRDPRRDKTHGRIWRITAKGRPLVEKPKLVGATVPQLLDQLKSPEGWTRDMAKQVLKERGAKEVLPALAEWQQKLDPKHADYEHHRLEALWTYQALGAVNTDLLDGVLNSPDARARAAACRVVAARAEWLTDVLVRLGPRVADENPRVRLDAVRALARVPSGRAAVLAAQALDKPMDKWLDYALWLTLRELAPHWYDEVNPGRQTFGGDPKKLLFALRAADVKNLVHPIRALLHGTRLDKKRETEALVMLAEVGGPTDLELVLNVAVRASTSDDLRDVLVTAVEASARGRKVGVPRTPAALLQLAGMGGPRARQAALRLLGHWKSIDGHVVLRTVAGNGGGSHAAEDQRAAFEGLALEGGDGAKDFLKSVAGSTAPPATRALAGAALAQLDPSAAAAAAVELLASDKPPADPTELFAAFVNRKEGPAALAKALAGKTLPADVAKVGVRAARATAQPNAALVEALTKAGGLTDTKRALAGKELQDFLADVARHGDPVRGEAVYRRSDMACLKCHAVAGAGGLVGPDLSSLGASAPLDYVLDSLLNPNAKIKEGYNSFVVTTADDRVVTGVRIRETPKELVLRDNEDREVVVPTADIASRKDGQSLMPVGQTDPLTRQELLDLTRFLSELGKGQYAATPGKVVRRWQVLTPTQEARTIANRDRLAALVTAPNVTWSPAYSRVDGSLPAAEYPSIKGHATSPPVVLVRFQVEVTTAGKVALAFDDATGLEAWVGATPLEVAQKLTLDLPAGTHTVTVGVNVAARTKPLRVELDEVPGSVARARVLGGK